MNFFLISFVLKTSARVWKEIDVAFERVDYFEFWGDFWWKCAKLLKKMALVPYPTGEKVDDDEEMLEDLAEAPVAYWTWVSVIRQSWLRCGRVEVCILECERYLTSKDMKWGFHYVSIDHYL
jgi:hypothetical protein